MESRGEWLCPWNLGKRLTLWNSQWGILRSLVEVIGAATGTKANRATQGTGLNTSRAECWGFGELESFGTHTREECISLAMCLWCD